MKIRPAIVTVCIFFAVQGFVTMLASCILADSGLLSCQSADIMAVVGLYVLASAGIVAILAGRPWKNGNW